MTITESSRKLRETTPNEDDDSSKLFLTQLLVALVMFLGVLLFTVLPYWIIMNLKRNRSSSAANNFFSSSRGGASRHCLVITLGRLSCFTGGVFISTGFLDLFPEVEECLKSGSQRLGFLLSYPLAPFFTLFGFLIFLTIEQVILISKERTLNSDGSSTNRQSKALRSPISHNSGSAEANRNPNVLEVPSTSIMERNCWSERAPLMHTQSLVYQTNPLHRSCDACGGHMSVNRMKCDPCLAREAELEQSSHYLDGISDVPVLHAECDKSLKRFHSIQVSNHNEVQQYRPSTEEASSPPPSSVNTHSCAVLYTNDSQHSSLGEHADMVASSSSDGEAMVHSHFSELPHHGTLRTVVLVLAICIHAVFEGLALGLQTTTDNFFTLLVALILHKGVIAAGIGLNLATSSFPPWLCRLVCVLFSAASPLGILVGLLIHWQSGVKRLTGQAELVSGSLQGLACGTFFYIVFFEILPHEFNSGVDRMGKLLSLCCGFGLVSVYLLFAS